MGRSWTEQYAHAHLVVRAYVLILSKISRLFNIHSPTYSFWKVETYATETGNARHTQVSWGRRCMWTRGRASVYNASHGEGGRVRQRLFLSVTNSASAPFPATLLHACVILPKSTHHFHPAHARCGDLSFCRFLSFCVTLISDFRKNTAFKSYSVKTSQYANWHRLTSPDALALRTLEAPELTTKDVYWLPHAIYYCS